MSLVILLHGVTNRDPDEFVWQVFPNTPEGNEELKAFREDLPGRYDVSLVSGINYETVAIVATVSC